MWSTIFLIHFQTRVLLVERQFVVVDGGGSGHGCGGWQRRTAVLLGVSKGQPRNRECTKTATQSCGSGIVRSLTENGFGHTILREELVLGTASIKPGFVRQV